MRAELLTIDWAEELRRFHAARSARRSPGRHLSDVVSRIMRQINAKRFSHGAPNPILAHQGFVWEDVLSSVFARQFGFPTQIEAELDGIIGTLDGHRAKTNRPVEMKFTKISAANNITSNTFQHWHIRTMGYCKMFDATEAELIVFHVNGSYELGGGRFGDPIVKSYVLKFGRVEIDEHWDWICRIRDDMDEEEASWRRGEGP